MSPLDLSDLICQAHKINRHLLESLSSSTDGEPATVSPRYPCTVWRLLRSLNLAVLRQASGMDYLDAVASREAYVVPLPVEAEEGLLEDGAGVPAPQP